ncbi:MAG: polyprenol monophosphomannose synthase [Cellulomonadaceae bacterium]
MNSTLVIIPTYDERETLATTLDELAAAVPDADVLVVDDASPDGTGELAERRAGADDRVHVLHRTGKQGLGTAYVAGFRWALDRGYVVVVEMDADGSHRAQDLPLLLAELAARPEVDLVIGSRWVAGGEVVNWPRRREVLSRGANLYTRIMLGLGVADATAGFRAFRAGALRRVALQDVMSQGYCFQVDMTVRVHDLGGQIAEVPIVFVERRAGASKMSRTIVLEALWRVTSWGLARRGRQLVGAVQRRDGSPSDRPHD